MQGTQKVAQSLEKRLDSAHEVTLSFVPFLETAAWLPPLRGCSGWVERPLMGLSMGVKGKGSFSPAPPPRILSSQPGSPVSRMESGSHGAGCLGTHAQGPVKAPTHLVFLRPQANLVSVPSPVQSPRSFFSCHSSGGLSGAGQDHIQPLGGTAGWRPHICVAVFRA